MWTYQGMIGQSYFYKGGKEKQKNQKTTQVPINFTYILVDL